MLTYLGSGERFYGDSPIPMYGRPAWEFEAVLSGRIAPTFPDHPGRMGQASGMEPLGSRLWIFPPGLAHGWTGIAGEAAEVAVFHFDTIPASAGAFIRDRGHIAVPLDSETQGRLRDLCLALDLLRRGSDPLASLRFEGAALELSLLALEGVPPRELGSLGDRAAQTVGAALAWFSEHLAERPGVTDVARAVYCSPSHLRRLFVKTRGVPPQAAFEELRLGRAKALLGQGGATIKEIAWACGYDSQSCFSRAFRRAVGDAPSHWLQRS